MARTECHGFHQLGRGHVALVLCSPYRHPGRALCRPRFLPAYADPRFVPQEPSARAFRRLWKRFAIRLRYCHYATGLLLSMGLIPALRALDLPVQFDGMHLGIAFSIILTAQSI